MYSHDAQWDGPLHGLVCRGLGFLPTGSVAIHNKEVKLLLSGVMLRLIVMFPRTAKVVV